MSVVDYFVEPCSIENYSRNMKTLRACAASRGLRIDRVSKREALDTKFELQHLSFELRVRGELA